MHLLWSLIACKTYSSQQYWNTSLSQPTSFLLISLYPGAFCVLFSFWGFFLARQAVLHKYLRFILILSWRSEWHIQRYCASYQNFSFSLSPKVFSTEPFSERCSQKCLGIWNIVWNINFHLINWVLSTDWLTGQTVSGRLQILDVNVYEMVCCLISAWCP